MFLVKFACLSWLLTALSTAIFSENDFNYSVQMDEDGKYWLYWNVLNDTHIEFGVKVETLGWIGLGFSPNGQMPDSDIVLAWVDDNSTEVYLEDRFATERTVPEYDTIQSLTLIDGYQSDNYTYVRFIRPLYSCDDEDEDNDIEKGTSYIIYSWNDNDPISSGLNISIVWHGDNRGSKRINLLTYDNYNDVELPSDAQYFDVVMNNLSVPSNDTTYWIQLIELPLLNETHHIIRVEPIITDGNIGIVHHIVIYECSPSLVNESNIGLSMNSNDFSELTIPEVSCKGSPAFAWAVGGDTFSFPPNVGLELSGLPMTESTLQYVLLEIHYSNDEQSSDYVDSSGLRLWYTSVLREHSAGLIGVGINTDTNFFIPQGIDEVVTYGFCTSDCTSQGLNETVYIFSSMLHSHKLGVALRARHIDMNGTESQNIDVNWNYDFSYQQTVLLSNEIAFNPGDSIMLECYYQSLNRTNMTYGGESTKEEMCLAFLYVYPKPQLRWCTTSFLSSDIEAWNTIAEERGYLTESPYYYYNTSTQDAIDYYESLWTNYTERVQICYNSEGSLIDNLTVTIPVITQEYIDPYQCDYNNTMNDTDFMSSTTTSMPEGTSSSTTSMPEETSSSTTSMPEGTSSTTQLGNNDSFTSTMVSETSSTTTTTTTTTTSPILPLPTSIPTPLPTTSSDSSSAIFWYTSNINIITVIITFIAYFL